LGKQSIRPFRPLFSGGTREEDSALVCAVCVTWGCGSARTAKESCGHVLWSQTQEHSRRPPRARGRQHSLTRAQTIPKPEVTRSLERAGAGRWSWRTEQSGGVLVSAPLPLNPERRAGDVTPDLWPGPRPVEKLASSCSTSSSCQESLNRINLLEIGDHRSRGVRSPRAAPGPGRERLRSPLGKRDQAGGGGASDSRRGRAARGKALPVSRSSARNEGERSFGPVSLGRSWRRPPRDW
jgi:hypothetical protein